MRQREESERTIAGLPQCVPGPCHDPVDGLSGRAQQLESIGVVVGAHLRVVLGPPERLDPLGGAQVLTRALRTRDLPIGDVAYQQVPEPVLDLTLDRAAASALHELLLRQRMELLLGCSQRTEPEHLADNSRVLQERLLRAANESSRAAMIPCTVSGRSSALPRSSSIRTYCSA